MSHLRELAADRLLGAATTVGLDCHEMRANAEHSGVDMSGFDHLARVVVLHEWLSGVMIRVANAINPPR